MNKPGLDVGLRRPALYNPSLWSNAEVRDYYVARTALLDRFVADLKREKAGTRPQHRLIVGLRGMGKSTLLRRLAVAVEDEPDLDAQWLPLTFPEEQYNVAGLADFWLNCLDALGDQLEARGEREAVAAIDAEVERLDRKDGEGALQALLRTAARLRRRLLLLVDNVDLVFDRIRKEDWAFREALQAHPELLLIGASSRALEATYDYQAAFYDFFKVDELRGLSEDEMRETIVNLAKLRGADDVIRRVESGPGRLRVLHTLTGGNPRTAVLLYGVLLKGIDGDVRSDLEGLLDEVTPLYKARFEELPEQAQQLLDRLATAWYPQSAAALAQALGWKVNLVSAQLDRLAQAGVVEKVTPPRGKRLNYQVAERFFNIWYLMRTSRRLRRKLVYLVEFLRGLYSSSELCELAHRRLEGDFAGMSDTEYALALSQALGEAPLARALETKAIESLLAGEWRHRLGELFDLSGEDRDLLPKVERIRRRREARERIEKRLRGTGGEAIVELLYELPIDSDNFERRCATLEAATNSELHEQVAAYRAGYEQLCRWYGQRTIGALGKALATGEMASIADSEGAKAAAERFDCPALISLSRILALHEAGAGQDIDSESAGIARSLAGEEPDGAAYWLMLAGESLQKGKYEEAAFEARRVTVLIPEESSAWLILGMALLRVGELSDEQLSAARKCASASDVGLAARSLMALSLLCRDDAAALLWLAEAAHDVSGDDDVEVIVSLFGVALAKGLGDALLMRLDETGVSERLLPLREALAAAVAKNVALLNGVPPEVRAPARELLVLIAPELSREL